MRDEGHFILEGERKAGWGGGVGDAERIMEVDSRKIEFLTVSYRISPSCILTYISLSVWNYCLTPILAILVIISVSVSDNRDTSTGKAVLLKLTRRVPKSTRSKYAYLSRLEKIAKLTIGNCLTLYA